MCVGVSTEYVQGSVMCDACNLSNECHSCVALYDLAFRTYCSLNVLICNSLEISIFKGQIDHELMYTYQYLAERFGLIRLYELPTSLLCM